MNCGEPCYYSLSGKNDCNQYYVSYHHHHSHVSNNSMVSLSDSSHAALRNSSWCVCDYEEKERERENFWKGRNLWSKCLRSRIRIDLRCLKVCSVSADKELGRKTYGTGELLEPPVRAGKRIAFNFKYPIISPMTLYFPWCNSSILLM